MTEPLIFTASCNIWNSEHGACLDPTPKESGIVFRLVDKDTKVNLIAAWGAKYDSDSVTLVKDNGDQANQLNVGGDGKISFFIPDNDEDALGVGITSVFYLHLPDEHGTPSRDIDTLSFSYELENKDGCPKIWYKSFAVRYNDSLYHQGNHKTHFEFLK